MPGKKNGGDLYSLLGVSRGATLPVIRTAYRWKAEQYHPSKGGDPEVFACIREAYAVLISSERRAHYDDTGEILIIEDAAEGDFSKALFSARRSKSERPSTRPLREAPTQGAAALERPAAPKSPAGGQGGAAQRPRAVSVQRPRAGSVSRPRADQRAALRSSSTRRSSGGDAPPAKVNFAEAPPAAKVVGSETGGIARTPSQPARDGPAGGLARTAPQLARDGPANGFAHTAPQLAPARDRPASGLARTASQPPRDARAKGLARTASQPPRDARANGLARMASQPARDAPANGPARTAFQPVSDAPAKSKPCFDPPPREKPCSGSRPSAAEVTTSAAGPPARHAPPPRSQSARPTTLTGRRGMSVPKFMGGRPSARERETDADSQAGSSASTATPGSDAAHHADPVSERARTAAYRKAEGPAKALSLAEALAAAEAMADTADEPIAHGPAKPKPEQPLAQDAPPEEEEEEGLPELYAKVDCNGPLAYRCSQGVLFAKRSVEPTSKNIVKLVRPVGTYVYSTGRRWKGPSGGTWCELARLHVKEDNVRWMLVKGPGFDLGGPALIDASVLKAGGIYEASCVKVHHIGYRESHKVIFESFMSKEATIWGVKKAIQEATGLNANRCYLSRQLPSTAPRPPGMEDDEKRTPEIMLQHVKDEESVRAMTAQEEEDVLLYLVYTGEFERDYKPAKAFGEA